ncbi:alpha/beta fold hydrolase [Streptomyces sp. NPDC058989]|uniref:alpha/beta fold hydrolase n=1 Tax=Streptomyces sp. NPDC058989 TaxID=3346686 RepID=UPI0036CF1169
MSGLLVRAGSLRFNVHMLAAAEPSAVPVVLLHGMLHDSLASHYFLLGPRLRAANFDVLLYDQRGHGKSDRPADGYHLHNFIDDLDRLLEVLETPRPLHLIGNSFGGTVAFGWAQRHPDQVASLVLIESEPATEAWAHKMRTLMDRAISELSPDENLAGIAARFGTHVSRVRAVRRALQETSLAQDIPASAGLTPEQIGTAGFPVLALYGGDSDMALQALGMRDALPHCRIETIAGHGHSLLVEEPRKVCELILPWLAEHTPHGTGSTVKTPWPNHYGEER